MDMSSSTTRYEKVSPNPVFCVTTALVGKALGAAQYSAFPGTPAVQSSALTDSGKLRRPPNSPDVDYRLSYG